MHDVCVESGLYSRDVILKVDECAVDFRRLSLDSVSVAKRGSDQWLDNDTTLAMFKTQDIENPEAVTKLNSR